MFNTISMTGSGILGLAVLYVLNLFGWDASMESIDGIILAVATFVTAAWAFWGQVRRNDLVAGFFRKDPK